MSGIWYKSLYSPDDAIIELNISSLYLLCFSVKCNQVYHIPLMMPSLKKNISNLFKFKLVFIQILSQFVKQPSDTLLRYFNMFHLAQSPSSVQFLVE
jgi:hypothetical protein